MSNGQDNTQKPIVDAGDLLRQQAEHTLLAQRVAQIEHYSAEEVRQLVHELHVHQIELELQNDQLRETQLALESSQSRYFDLYELAPVGYLTLNADGVVQEANLTVTLTLQTPKSRLLNRSLAYHIAAEDQDIYYHYYRHLITINKPQTCEVRVRDIIPDRWIRLESTATQNPNNGIIIYRTVMVDISERVHAEIKLIQLNESLEQLVTDRTAALQASEQQLRAMNTDLKQIIKLKDDFLAMMSHELRTPLNAILGFSEALIAEVYGPISERQSRALSMVMRSGQNLLAVLSDILDLARIAAGRELLNPTLVDLQQLCNSVLQLVQPSIQLKGHQVHYTMIPPLAKMYADERRLTQILLNLLNNAVKFTPAGGTIGLEVTAHPIEHNIQFSVWDTGIGIVEADQERIFEPFIQSNSDLSRHYDGVGLGLALVSQLVELHHGHIRLSSTIGMGSNFIVIFPWSPIDPRSLLEANAAGDSGMAWKQQPQILIVDDDELSRTLCLDLLSQKGYLVTMLDNGIHVVTTMLQTPPHLLILDIQMPGMDGLQVLEQIRRIPELAQIPVIALTALAINGDRERCLAAGANAYLTKPVNLQTLLTTIFTLLTETPPMIQA